MNLCWKHHAQAPVLIVCPACPPKWRPPCSLIDQESYTLTGHTVSWLRVTCIWLKLHRQKMLELEIDTLISVLLFLVEVLLLNNLLDGAEHFIPYWQQISNSLFGLSRNWLVKCLFYYKMQMDRNLYSTVISTVSVVDPFQWASMNNARPPALLHPNGAEP